MVKTLYLIRHGETEGAEKRRYKGTIDVPLSERGIEQMRRVAAFIPQGLSAVYCSPLQRAVKSAGIIAEPQKLNPVQVAGLRERSFGIWEGMSFDEIRDRYPGEFDAWASNPLLYSPMEGESTLTVRDRVVAALNRVMEGHDREDVRIAIVAHGGVNRIVLCHLTGIPLENIFRIDQDYGAVNVIEFWDSYPVLKLVNGLVTEGCAIQISE